MSQQDKSHEEPLSSPPDSPVWIPDLPVPTEEEHNELLVSPDARAERTAQRIGNRILPFVGHIRGRRRHGITAIEQLNLEYAAVITDDEVVGIARAISRYQPLFNRFTRGYKVPPVKDSIERYVLAMGRKTVKRDNDIRNPEERRQAMVRRSNHILDDLQQRTLAERDTAALRRWSIAAVQYAIKHDLPIDPDAMVHASDALLDFGDTLLDKHNTRIMGKNSNPRKFADSIKFIGTKASSDPEYFRQNQSLLRLVRIEQRARSEYWGKIYDATIEYGGDRLTSGDKDNIRENKQEVLRLKAIVDNG